jgi:hypothetical protein
MLYKRPNFKMGGSPTGIETLEPRKKFQDGTDERKKFLGFPIPGTAPARNPDGSLVTIPKRNFADDALFFLGPGKFLKAGGGGLEILKQAGKFATKPNFFGTTSGVSQKTLDKAPLFSNQRIRETIRPYTSGIMETLKTSGRGIKDFGKKYGIALGGTTVGGGLAFKGIKDYLDDEREKILTGEDSDDFVAEGRVANVRPGESALDAVIREGKVLAELRDPKGRKFSDAPESKDTKTGGETKEFSFEDEFNKQVNRIEKYLGSNKQEDRGKLALALSDAIGTPGTLADKAAVLNKSLLGIASARKKDKKDIAKLAFAAATELEGKRIDAGKLTSSEKNRQRYVFLSNKTDRTAEEDSELKALEGQLRLTSSGFSVTGGGRFGNLLTDLTDSIFQFDALNENDPNYDRIRAGIQASINGLLRIEGVDQTMLLEDLDPKVVAILRKRGFLKEGGRVNMAMGGATETPAAPVDTKLSFDELRSRLPKEITDDIVRLVSTSEEALQDFAYIRTQGDVEKFNTKYGVNLVLPQNTA